MVICKTHEQRKYGFGTGTAHDNSIVTSMLPASIPETTLVLLFLNYGDVHKFPKGSSV